MKKQKSKEEYYEYIYNNVDFSIAEHEMIYNEKGEAIDYKFLYANKAFCDSLDISLDNLIGNSVLDLFPDTEKYWIDEYNKVVKTGKPLAMIRHAAEFEKQFSVYAFKSGENTFFSSFKDVTEVNDRFSHNGSEKPEYRVSQDVSKMGFFEANRLNQKAEVSDAFCEIVGLKEIKEGFFRNTLLELTHPDDFNKMSNQIKDILKGNISELETEFQFFNKRKNEYRWMSFFIFAIESDENEIPFRYTGIIRDIEEEKMRAQEKKETEFLFREARRVADLSTFMYKTDINEFESSQELDNFTGVKDLKTIEQYRKIVHPEDLGDYDDATDYTLSNAEGRVALYRIIKDNQEKFVQSSVYALKNNKGKTKKVFGILKDVTEIETARREAENARRSFELIFNTSPTGIITISKEFEITMENRTFREMFDSKENEIKLRYLLGDMHDSAIKELEKNDVCRVVVEHVIKNKTKIVAINFARIDEEFINEFQGTVFDITEQSINKEKINYMASHDVLTGLYNRYHFEGVVENKLLNFPLGIIMCDIDGLKLINDAFGHLEGDKLLKDFSKELEKLFPLYVLSRIGGDEFTILVENTTEEELEEFSSKIKESIKNIRDFKVEFGVSVGYSILIDENSDYNRMFNKAENMMYHRKLTERRSRKSNALQTIMQTLHEKTEETMIHCLSVGDYASMILADYGYKRVVDLDDIRFLSEVHDIGKVATPEGIFSKKTRLTDSEYEEIKYHSEAGFKIIKNIIDKDQIAYGVLYHHERYDGKGYPHGLKGEDIPLFARIIAIADSYDTMVRGRVYQKPISKKDALLEIAKNSGTQFDPHFAASFIRLMEEKNE